MNHFLRHADGDRPKAREKNVTDGTASVSRRGVGLTRAEETAAIDEMADEVKAIMAKGISGDDALQIVLNQSKILDLFGGEKATQKRVADAVAAEAKKNKGFKSAEEAQAQASKASTPSRGFKSAEEAQAQAAKTTSKSASSSRTFGSAAEAQAQASAVTNKEAAKKSIALASEKSKQGAAEAQAQASSTSASDAAARAQRQAAEKQTKADAAAYIKAKMNWNDPTDATFAEWKKKYNQQYYEEHKREWLDPEGKYYPIHQKAKRLRDLAVAQDPNASQDLATYLTDPEEKAKYNAYRQMVRNNLIGKNASGASDTELGRKYHEMITNRERAANSSAARALYENRDNNVEAPSFLKELGKSAKNFATNVGDLSGKAVSTGRNFINNLVRQIRG